MCNIQFEEGKMDFLGEDSEEEEDLLSSLSSKVSKEEIINKYLIEICQQSFKFIMNHREHSSSSSSTGGGAGGNQILIITNHTNNQHVTSFSLSFLSFSFISSLQLFLEIFNCDHLTRLFFRLMI